MKQNMKRKPYLSAFVLTVIISCCLLAKVIAPFGSTEMDPGAVSMAPGAGHIFGTDAMGRDLFSMLLYGGRASIYIGLMAAAVSTVIAVVYGAVSGMAGRTADSMMMGFAELVMSVPSILLILFLQAIWGKPPATSIALAIGLTGWMNMAKVIRSEVRQIGKSDYILAARTMGADFGYILKKHLLPNFISSIMYMVVTAIGQAMITESTLSFLGLGLPMTTVSWGSLMSMSESVLLSNCWWLIVIPASVLVTTLVCLTQLGEYIRKENNRLHSNL